MSLPILGIAAYSGTGKTTLLKSLIPFLASKGIRVAVIKHAHHNFDVDTPGKDSYEIRQAGASQTLVASHKRWALMTETPQEQQPDLHYLLQQLDPALTDLVLVEGFKEMDIPKILLDRQETGKGTPEPTAQTLAIASDQPIESDLPWLDINRIESIGDFIAAHFGFNQAEK